MLLDCFWFFVSTCVSNTEALKLSRFHVLFPVPLCQISGLEFRRWPGIDFFAGQFLAARSSHIVDSSSRVLFSSFFFDSIPRERAVKARGEAAKDSTSFNFSFVSFVIVRSL